MISVFLSQLEDVYQTKAKQGTIAWPVGTDWAGYGAPCGQTRSEVNELPQIHI